VTFVLSSLNTSASGGGRKSSTRSSLPTASSPGGSSLYLVFFFINFLSSAPCASADDAYSPISEGKPDCHNSLVNPANAKVSVFSHTAAKIVDDYPVWVGKRILGVVKGNPMFYLILNILVRIPFKAFHAHSASLENNHTIKQY
jgi:hypothetical protein